MLPTLLLSAALAAQTPAQKPPTPPEPVKLTGCVSAKPEQGGDYTILSDGIQGVRYRLTGKDVRKYAGKKVEVVEETPKKGFVVKGGLYPSPNVAGRAGDLDPAQAAIATQPGAAATAGTGAPLPEFRAGRIRAVNGSCQ